jgi:hypothetical protein
MAKHTLAQKLNLFTVIFADPHLGSTTKVVAAWLLFYHHNTATGLCIPSNGAVGKAIGLSPENVSRHTNKLVKAGFLLVQQRFGTSNSFDFNWSRGSVEAVEAVRTRLRRASPDPPSEMGMTKMRGEVDESGRGSCQNEQGSPDENDNLILEDNTEIEDGKITPPREHEGFPIYKPSKRSQSPTALSDTIVDSFVARFRSIYPLQISEDEVPSIRAAARRALALADSESILDGAMRYHGECSGREANYIADPVNWLNGRKWSGKGKIKTDTVILGSDGSPIPASRHPTIRDRIQQWRPAQGNQTSEAIKRKLQED